MAAHGTLQTHNTQHLPSTPHCAAIQVATRMTLSGLLMHLLCAVLCCVADVHLSGLEAAPQQLQICAPPADHL